jgi:hypothetical protein
MSAQYYYLVSSLPVLSIGGEKRTGKEQFLDECSRWLTAGDMRIIMSADREKDGARDAGSALQKELDLKDFRLRKTLASIRKELKKGEKPRIPDELKPVMNAPDPLKKEIELARVRWAYLDREQALHFFDVNWLTIYFIKVQILERLDSFDKDRGEAVFYELCDVAGALEGESPGKDQSVRKRYMDE